MNAYEALGRVIVQIVVWGVYMGLSVLVGWMAENKDRNFPLAWVFAALLITPPVAMVVLVVVGDKGRGKARRARARKECCESCSDSGV